MKLYAVRHAEAIDKTAEIPEALRYLTTEGRSFFRETARRMAGRVSIDFIFASPMVRAVQTAEILASETGFTGRLIVVGKLSPGFAMEDLRDLLAKYEGAKEIALVGHEPDLGNIVASLRSLASRPLKKGEAVALEIPKKGKLSPAAFLWSAAGKKIVDGGE